MEKPCGVEVCEMNEGLAADLIFVNGQVYTVDQDDRLTESLAVKDGRVLFVGPEREARALVGPRTEVVDLAGAMLLPGFVDTHLHTPGPLTGKLFDFDLSGTFEADQTIRAIEAAVQSFPDNDLYFGLGYPTGAFTGPERFKGPKKEWLDAINSDKPIIVMANDCHTLWMNSKALEKFAITAETQAPPGGMIEKNDQTGELWGTLKDSAMVLARDLRIPPEKMIRVLAEYQVLMNGLGYTSIMSMAAEFIPIIGNIPWAELEALEAADRLTLKVSGTHCILTAADLETKIEEAKALRDKYDSSFLRLNTIKFFADGVVDARTAYLLEPYEDDPGNRGDPSWTSDQLREACARVNTEGFQIHTHAIGDAATRQVLDAYEYALAHSPAGDYRNTITHLQIVDPQDRPRFKALSVLACVQPYWHIRQPGFWEPVEHQALGQRAELEYPLKSLFDAGVVVASSSDSPITAHPNPLAAIQTGVTRNLVDGAEYGVPDITDPDEPTCLLGPEERASVRQMIRSFTANGAYATFSENETGSLVKGKWADLVVLDKNILTCPVLEIHQARVLKTYVNGRLVYSRE